MWLVLGVAAIALAIVVMLPGVAGDSSEVLIP